MNIMVYFNPYLVCTVLNCLFFPLRVPKQIDSVLNEGNRTIDEVTRNLDGENRKHAFSLSMPEYDHVCCPVIDHLMPFCLCDSGIGPQLGKAIQGQFSRTLDPALTAVTSLDQGACACMVSYFSLSV